MQVLTDTQRALLAGDHVEVSAGLELLDLDLSVTDDISDDLVSGSVTRNMDARIHGTCRLRLTRELDWGRQLVRPYMTLTDRDATAHFNTGVYMLITPERVVGETPAMFDTNGFDRLYLLDREVGDDYTATTGTTYRQALLDAFAAADLTGVVIDTSADDLTLPADRVWSLVARSTDPDQTNTPVTWLRIVNDLLSAINFQAVWADENGIYRCHEYREPAVRAIEHIFDADDAFTIVGEDRTIVADQWKTPNRWVFLRTNGGTGVEGDGVYTVDNVSDGPLSQDARGLVWTKVYSYDAADQATLEALGDRRVAMDRRIPESIKVTTGTFPAAGHYDVFSYADVAAGGTRKVVAADWDLDLLGADMRWTWQTVTV